MLLVFSAICWTIWKHRNELCFESGKKKTTRQIILLIISLVHYWTGQVKPRVQECMSLWLPVDTEAIPLARWHPMISQWSRMKKHLLLRSGTKWFYMKKLIPRWSDRVQMPNFVLAITYLSPLLFSPLMWLRCYVALSTVVALCGLSFLLMSTAIFWVIFCGLY